MQWFMKLTLAKKLLSTFITLAAITAGVGWAKRKRAHHLSRS